MALNLAGGKEARLRPLTYTIDLYDGKTTYPGNESTHPTLCHGQDHTDLH